MTAEQKEALAAVKLDNPPPVNLSGDALDLYRALLRIVRQNAQVVPIGHDAILAARTALARASGRSGKAIDWAKEKMP